METVKEIDGVVGLAYQPINHDLYVLLLHSKKKAKTNWVGLEFIKGTVGKREPYNLQKLFQHMAKEGEEEANILHSTITPLIIGDRHYTYQYQFHETDGTLIKKFMYVFLIDIDKSEQIKTDNKEHDRFVFCPYLNAYNYLQSRTLKEILRVAEGVIKGRYH